MNNEPHGLTLYRTSDYGPGGFGTWFPKGGHETPKLVGGGRIQFVPSLRERLSIAFMTQEWLDKSNSTGTQALIHVEFESDADVMFAVECFVVMAGRVSGGWDTSIEGVHSVNGRTAVSHVLQFSESAWLPMCTFSLADAEGRWIRIPEYVMDLRAYSDRPGEVIVYLRKMYDSRRIQPAELYEATLTSEQAMLFAQQTIGLLAWKNQGASE